jgi:hypothetical protein
VCGSIAAKKEAPDTGCVVFEVAEARCSQQMHIVRNVQATSAAEMASIVASK